MLVRSKTPGKTESVAYCNHTIFHLPVTFVALFWQTLYSKGRGVHLSPFQNISPESLPPSVAPVVAQQRLFQVQRSQAYNPCYHNEMVFHVCGGYEPCMRPEYLYTQNQIHRFTVHCLLGYLG